MRRAAAPGLLRRAALAGLVAAAVFAMHGPSVGSGCAAGEVMTRHAGTSATPNIVNHMVATVWVTADVLPAPTGYGQMCLSTPPRPGPAAVPIAWLTALVGLAKLVVAAVLPIASGTGSRLRGPPRAGTALLRCLCVSRT